MAPRGHDSMAGVGRWARLLAWAYVALCMAMGRPIAAQTWPEGDDVERFEMAAQRRPLLGPQETGLQGIPFPGHGVLIATHRPLGGDRWVLVALTVPGGEIAAQIDLPRETAFQQILQRAARDEVLVVCHDRILIFRVPGLERIGEIAAPAGRSFFVPSGLARTAVVTSDGRRAFVSTDAAWGVEDETGIRTARIDLEDLEVDLLFDPLPEEFYPSNPVTWMAWWEEQGEVIDIRHADYVFRWDAASGKRLARYVSPDDFEQFPQKIASVVPIEGEGRWMVLYGNHARVLNPRTEEYGPRLAEGTFRFPAARLVHDRSRLIAGTKHLDEFPGRVYVVGWPGLQPLRDFPAHRHPLFQLQPSADGRWIFSTPFAQQDFAVYDAETGERLLWEKGAPGRIQDVQFLPDGRRFLTETRTNTIQWNVEGLEPVDPLFVTYPFSAGSGYGPGFSVSPDGETFVVALDAEYSQVHRTDTGEIVRKLGEWSADMRAFGQEAAIRWAEHLDERRVQLAPAGLGMLQLDTESGEVDELDLPADGAGDSWHSGWYFPAAGMLVAVTSSHRGRVGVWRVEKPGQGAGGGFERVQQFDFGVDDGVVGAALRSEARVAFLLEKEGNWEIQVMEVGEEGLESLDTLYGTIHPARPTRLAFVGPRVLVLGEELDEGSRLRIVDIHRGEDLATLPIKDTGRMSCLRVSPSGREIVVGHVDGTVTLFRIPE